MRKCQDNVPPIPVLDVLLPHTLDLSPAHTIAPALPFAPTPSLLIIFLLRLLLLSLLLISFLRFTIPLLLHTLFFRSLAAVETELSYSSGKVKEEGKVQIDINHNEPPPHHQPQLYYKDILEKEKEREARRKTSNNDAFDEKVRAGKIQTAAVTNGVMPEVKLSVPVKVEKAKEIEKGEVKVPDLKDKKTGEKVKLQADKEKLRLEEEKLLAEKERLRLVEEKLKEDKEKLRQEEEKLGAVEDKPPSEDELASSSSRRAQKRLAQITPPPGEKTKSQVKQKDMQIRTNHQTSPTPKE